MVVPEELREQGIGCDGYKSHPGALQSAGGHGTGGGDAVKCRAHPSWQRGGRRSEVPQSVGGVLENLCNGKKTPRAEQGAFLPSIPQLVPTACHPAVLCTPIQAHPFIWSQHLPKATCDPECLYCCEDKLKGGRQEERGNETQDAFQSILESADGNGEPREVSPTRLSNVSWMLSPFQHRNGQHQVKTMEFTELL